MARCRTISALAAALALGAFCPLAHAAGILVGPGASLDAGDAEVDLNCLDAVVEGNLVLGAGRLIAIGDVDVKSTGHLSAGAGIIRFHGDWRGAGTFNPGTSQVSLLDGCGVTSSVLTGDNDFSSFTAITSTGRALRVEADSLQTFSAHLGLEGVAPGQRLSIRSTIGGQASNFVLFEQASQQISAVDVRDNDASLGQALAPGAPDDYDSVDSGNNKNWFQQLLDLIFKDGFETEKP